jgi:hypothetical protein
MNAPNKNESARLSSSTGANTLQLIFYLTTDKPEGDLPAYPSCGANARRLGPGAGPHHQRLECASCGRWLRWLPRPREDAHE